MRDNFTFFKSFADAVDDLPAEEYQTAMKTIFRYAFYGEEPKDISGIVKVYFVMAKPIIDSTGKGKGGRPLKWKGAEANKKGFENHEYSFENSENSSETIENSFETSENSKKTIENSFETSENSKKTLSMNKDMEEEKDVDIEEGLEKGLEKGTHTPPTPSKGERERERERQAAELFEILWKLYPKKEGKGQVSMTHKKELLKVGLDEMTRCIDRYKEAKKDTEPRYIMMGSTFFNSGYVDYLDKNYNTEEPKEPAEEIVPFWNEELLKKEHDMTPEEFEAWEPPDIEIDWSTPPPGMTQEEWDAMDLSRKSEDDSG